MKSKLCCHLFPFKRKALQYLFVPIVFILCLISYSSFGEIYKYQDKDGKWVFSDKKPEEKDQIENVETLTFKSKAENVHEIQLFTEKRENVNFLVAKNPFFAPVEIELKSSFSGQENMVFKLEPNSTTDIYKSLETIPKYQYRWMLGDSEAKHDFRAKYLFPVISNQKFVITQGFGGRFSHFSQANFNAVDIGMQVGSELAAARGGTVIWVKEDYHMGGAARYFLDKANYISILHEDGTYAIYAHILQGSAEVAAGEKVRAGEKIALSGSSGFSTGPHLHFVVRRNAGFKVKTERIKFTDRHGKAFTPKRGMKIQGLPEP